MINLFSIWRRVPPEIRSSEKPKRPIFFIQATKSCYSSRRTISPSYHPLWNSHRYRNSEANPVCAWSLSPCGKVRGGGDTRRSYEKLLSFIASISVHLYATCASWSLSYVQKMCRLCVRCLFRAGPWGPHLVARSFPAAVSFLFKFVCLPMSSVPASEYGVQRTISQL